MYPFVSPIFKPGFFNMYGWYMEDSFDDDLDDDFDDDYDYDEDDYFDDTIDEWEDYTLLRGNSDLENMGNYELHHGKRCNIYAAMATRVKESFTQEEARKVGEVIGIDWDTSPFDVEEFRKGMDVELEHGQRSPETNVTGDNPILTGKIALAHLNEFPDYYQRLSRMEEEAKAFWMMEE